MCYVWCYDQAKADRTSNRLRVMESRYDSYEIIHILPADGQIVVDTAFENPEQRPRKGEQGDENAPKGLDGT